MKSVKHVSFSDIYDAAILVDMHQKDQINAR